MGRLAGLMALLVFVSACSVGTARGSLLHSPLPSPSPSPSPAALVSPPPTQEPSPLVPSPSPPSLKVACKGGGGSAMVMLKGAWTEQRLLYDVTDPVRPRLICNISNTSAHLVPDGSVEWLKPISDGQT